ncbi:MAG TPA: MBL fold metallo-hydrolase [Firmicutes bacterium]|nr:MBL fold metallo-hydrolase [Bacillota bacterium]
MDFLDYVDAVIEVLNDAHWTDYVFVVLLYLIAITALSKSWKKNKRKIWYNYMWLVAFPPVGLQLIHQNRKIKKKLKKQITTATYTIMSVFVLAIGIYLGWLPKPEYSTLVDSQTVIENQGLSKRENGLELRVHYLDIGQGDATLIEYGDYHVLIDGGNNGKEPELLAYMEQIGVDDIEILIATHPDADHIGGLKEVLEAYDVALIIDSGEAHSSKTYRDYYEQVQIQVSQGGTYLEDDDMIFYLADNVVFEIIETGDENGDRNNNSVVTRLTYDDVDFIFTGDMESGVEQTILNRNLEASILKVGHHGSRTSSSQEFLDAVKPEVAIISAGLNNTYGHPHQEALNRLNDVDAKTYTTFERGHIVVKTFGQTYEVICNR